MMSNRAFPTHGDERRLTRHMRVESSRPNHVGRVLREAFRDRHEHDPVGKEFEELLSKLR